MSSQDDSREKAQKALFDVEDYSLTGRGRTYTPDAKLLTATKEYTIEFKSKPQTKSEFSTARGFGAAKAQEWEDKTDVFVFSEFEGTDFNGNFTEHYALTYDDLRPIIEDKVLKPYYEGRKKYLGMREWEDVVQPLLNSLPEDMINRIQYTLQRGTSLNDPKFPWAYIKEHGTHIKTAEDLKRFCLKRTIKDKT